MEIEEGDTVVTPEGIITEVVRLKNGVWTKHGNSAPDYCVTELVKLNASIRLRVDEPEEAGFLVALAEGHGFQENIGDWDVRPSDYKDFPCVVKFNPNLFGSETKIYNLGDNQSDLNFESDYAQIKRWLIYHSESEGECERCGGEEKIVVEENVGELERELDVEILGRNAGQSIEVERPCSNCTDDFEPRSENEEWDSHAQEDSFAQRIIDVIEDWEEENEPNKLTRSLEMAYGYINGLKEKIDDLESELEDVREERDKIKEQLRRSKIGRSCNCVFEKDQHGSIIGYKHQCFEHRKLEESRDKYKYERDDLQERIEEYGLKISKARQQVNVALVSDKNTDLVKIKRVLPDVYNSDEETDNVTSLNSDQLDSDQDVTLDEMVKQIEYFMTDNGNDDLWSIDMTVPSMDVIITNENGKIRRGEWVDSFDVIREVLLEIDDEGLYGKYQSQFNLLSRGDESGYINFEKRAHLADPETKLCAIYWTLKKEGKLDGT